MSAEWKKRVQRGVQRETFREKHVERLSAANSNTPRAPLGPERTCLSRVSGETAPDAQGTGWSFTAYWPPISSLQSPHSASHPPLSAS